jgi:hypothetical protein
LASCSAAVPVFPGNIRRIERFVWGLYSAPIHSLQFPVLGLYAPSGRLGSVTVLPQLKVDRLCAVVDGTAEFDHKQTSRIARWGSPTGDAMQLVCLLAALVAVSQILALFLPARLKVRMSFLAPRTQRWGPIGILGSQFLRGTPTHPARWSS